MNLTYEKTTKASNDALMELRRALEPIIPSNGVALTCGSYARRIDLKRGQLKNKPWTAPPPLVALPIDSTLRALCKAFWGSDIEPNACPNQTIGVTIENIP